MSEVRVGNVGTEAGPFGDHTFSFETSGGPVSVELTSACAVEFELALVGTAAQSGSGLVRVDGTVGEGQFSVGISALDDPGSSCAYSITVTFESFT